MGEDTKQAVSDAADAAQEEDVAQDGDAARRPDELNADDLNAGEPAAQDAERRDAAAEASAADASEEDSDSAADESQPVAGEHGSSVEEEIESEGDDGGDAEDDSDESADDSLASQMDWYILKVQSNRENSIADALRRRVAMEGLDDYFGEIIVPVEKVTELKGGKKKIVKRKLYPGYIVVQMVIDDDTWFLVRETPGVGDFTGAGGKPTPMLPHEIEKIKPKVEEEETGAEPKFKIAVRPGDRVKVTNGTFENFEGEVSTVDEVRGRVTVMINIFGRPTPAELEYWQVESL